MTDQTHKNVTGVVLCGGHSRRFGGDKAIVRKGGVSLVERCVSVLTEVVPRVVLASGPADRRDEVEARHIPDAVPDAGPLAGISSVFSAIESDHLLVLAVDLPAVSRTSLLRLIEPPIGSARVLARSRVHSPARG